MKADIEQLKKAIADAKARQSEASKDIKRIEKDIKDFDSNKDNKLAELQASLETLRKSQTKNLGAVKVLQKDAQEARVEAEQMGGDLDAAKAQLEECENALKAHDADIEGLVNEQNSVKVTKPTAFTLIRY